MIKTFIGATLIVAGVSLSCFAVEVQPVLKPQADVVAALAKLENNSSCLLGDPTVIEDLGDFAEGWHRMKETGPAGRDFTLKMAWMPDRQRAFFCGANHGSPHRFNDAWEYDLASNTWVLLYKPDYNDRGAITDYDKKTLVLDKGWLRTKKGGPAHPAHTWWGLTYDPQRKKIVWYCAWPGYRLDAKLEAIGGTREDLYKGPPIWTFSPEEQSWQPLPTEEPWPRNAFGASLEYIPSLGGMLWQYRQHTWLLDSKQPNWTLLQKDGEALPIETLVCHDAKRRMLIAHRGPHKEELPRTWHMSLADETPGPWKQVLQQDGLPNGHDARSWMYFDPIGEVALLYERETKKIWSYEPGVTRWTELKPDGPAPPFGERERVLSYMDTARNVFVVIGYDAVWCYRYRK